MSIQLRKANWLVADWVMRALHRDIKILKTDFEIEEDFQNSNMKGFFFLNYENINQDKLDRFNHTIDVIIKAYEDGYLKFEGSRLDYFESYKNKLHELKSYLTKERYSDSN